MKNTATRLDWGVGCGAFGRLLRPDGTSTLIETLWFNETTASVVRLTDGDREIVPWAAKPHLITVIPDAAACDEAGMPAPGRVKVGDSWRRVDPFHSERHRSQRFRALVALIYDRRLPCRYSLLAAAADDDWDFGGPCVEDPEQTAGNVAERVARDPDLPVAEALRAELLSDAEIATGDTGGAQELLSTTGWTGLLDRLEAALAHYANAAPTPPTPAPALAAVAAREDAQLSFQLPERSSDAS